MVIPKVDFICFGAHADDVELCMGGTLLKMLYEGARGLVVDLTKATAATRGSVEERLEEASQAAKTLNIPRINLGLTDAHLVADFASEKAIIEIIRKSQPKIIFTHPNDDYHPDHMVCHELVKRAWYRSGLKSLYPEWSAHRTGRFFNWVGPVSLKPDFCVDITPFFEKKMESILTYKSQFYNADASKYSDESQISSPEFLEFITTRNRAWGTEIRTQYAEAFLCREIPEIINPMDLSTRPY
jgi:bacillithiol biosynthesis deacetylase BshB1